MTNNRLEKWRSLISNLEIIPANNPGGALQMSTLSKVELTRIEGESALVFPDEYKAYCQVFGDGIFGWSEFHLSPPYPFKFDRYLLSKKIELEACQHLYPWSCSCLELLDNAYGFGCGEGDVHFVFDLRTYNSADRSANIYGLECYNGYTYSFGRDFFAFVRDYCIGKKAEIECPELLIGIAPYSDLEDPRCRPSTFISFSWQDLQF